MRLLIAAACLFFLSFAAVRAARVPLTYDEAAAYLRYVDTEYPSVFNTSFLSVFSFEVATNHFLNTLLTKAFSLAAGGSEFVLRVPNLIGYAMYIGFSLLILFGFTRRAIAFAGFMLLNLNPYVLDFFTLSRGYGLSLGFLMAALFFLLRLVERLPTGGVASHDVSRTLLFACGAVMANFALLNVYLGIFGVVFAALLIFNSSRRGSPVANAAPASPVQRRRAFSRLPLMATVFTALVLSQDVGLTTALYDPVTVTLVGLDPAELADVRMTRIDIRGRETRVGRDASTTAWRTVRDHVRGLRIELPAASANRIGRIETIIGNHPFSSDPRQGTAWNSHDAGSRRVLESGPSLSSPRSRLAAFRPLLNWAGDGRYAANLAAHTACALSILAAFALLLKGVGRVMARSNILTANQWRPLATGALWLAALAGTPLYLLRRDSQLYYGGVQGLVTDTFYSIIDNSFYGRTYHPAQTRIVFACILATLVAFCLVLYASYRRRKLSAIAPAACVLAIMVITSLSVIAQHSTFRTVYLLGRTALFYIPLFVLFLTLLCERMADLGRTGKVLATAILAVVVAFSAYHFKTTANVKYTWDWLHDASTRQMVDDLGQMVAGERGPGSHVVLGVDWIYNPVAVYYAHRNRAAVIDVVGLPSARGIDFLYLDYQNVGPAMNVVRRFPFTGSALVRLGS
jgi:hypothetical protein